MNRTAHTKSRVRPTRSKPPIAQKKRAGLSEAPPPSFAMERAGTRTVLVVEDDDDVLGLIADVLRERGHTVYAARDGESALKRLGAVGVDLILLDLSLPDMSGKEFLEIRARVAQLATIPVVILSGSEDAGSFGERRRILVLRKPFGATELVRVVEREARP